MRNIAQNRKGMRVPRVRLRRLAGCSAGTEVPFGDDGWRRDATRILRFPLPKPAIAGVCNTMAVAAIAMLAGCASTPTELRFDTVTPTTLVATHDAGVRDLRGTYRIEVCRRLPAEAACDDVLLRLAGEPAAASVAPADDLAQRYRIAFVPGLFSECFERFARPFADVRSDLVASGFTVDYFRVPGRGSSAQNAVRLAEHFRGLDGDARPVILFAYSKGLVDVLEFMVRFPDDARRIAAVVAVAGAANGSPLADQLHGVYREWGATFPLPDCAAGYGR